MKILVDGDACPVKSIIEEVAKEKSIKTNMYFDYSHFYESNYSTVIVVPEGTDSVDYKIIEDVKVNDLVITNDYGLASLVLGKKAKVLTPNGLVLNDLNIDLFLHTRAMSQKMRNSGLRTKGPKKRTNSNNEDFKKILITMLKYN